jgi:hypothetical protein
VGISGTIKVTRLVYYLLKGLENFVKLHIIARIDKIGTIVMTKNSPAGVHTRRNNMVPFYS